MRTCIALCVLAACSTATAQDDSYELRRMANSLDDISWELMRMRHDNRDIAMGLWDDPFSSRGSSLGGVYGGSYFPMTPKAYRPTKAQRKHAARFERAVATREAKRAAYAKRKADAK